MNNIHPFWILAIACLAIFAVLAFITILRGDAAMFEHVRSAGGGVVLALILLAFIVFG